MAGQNQNFGLMDQAYFVSRSEVIAWVNDLLKLNISKIQELGSGAVYCQIFDAIYPGKVAMSKLNWRAKVDYEFLNNYKILQAILDKFGIKKYIEVEKLSKAKYQDNLQFIQWCKRYYEVNGGDKNQPYNAEQRRGNIKIDFGYAEKIVVPKSFNAVGQVIPKVKNSSKEKRADSGALGQRENPKRLASPSNNLPKAKSPSHQKKLNTVVDNKESRQGTKPSSIHIPPHYPPPIHKKVEQKQEKGQQSSIRPQKGSLQQLQNYKKIVRDLQSKLQMIAEITQSNDQAQMKMKLIQEVLSIGMNYSKVSEFKEDENKVKQTKYMQTINSQEVIEQSIQINESIKEYSSKVHTSSHKQEKEIKKQNGSRHEQEEVF